MILLFVIVALIAGLWMYCAIANWWTYSPETHKVLKLRILLGLLAFVLLADLAGL